MKRPDYEHIAATYDALALRHELPPEDALARAVDAAGGVPLSVLDVGCGTGNWLAAQAAAFGGRVALVGTDPSAAMLARARAKAPSARLLRGRAEGLPVGAARCGWVVTRFAYHHFDDKPAALDELVRVLAPGGTLQLVNLAPEHMLGWWILRWFPEAQAFSDARFWPVERLVAELAARGLHPTAAIERRRDAFAPAELLEQAARRDQSHLASLDDAAWEAGRARLARDLAATPETPVPSEMAIVRVTATSPR